MRGKSLVRDSSYMRTRGIGFRKDERVRGKATAPTAPALSLWNDWRTPGGKRLRDNGGISPAWRGPGTLGG